MGCCNVTYSLLSITRSIINLRLNFMIGLIDGNNFFASCERIFNPKLHNKPVIVLSNNDGCVVARSEDYVELKLYSKVKH